MAGMSVRLRGTFRSVQIAAIFAALMGCGPAASPGSPLPSAAGPRASTAITCAATGTPSPLDVRYLCERLARGSEGVAVEVLLAEDTSEVDLGKVPLVAALRLTGPAPVTGDDAIAFETSSVDGCAARILMDNVTLQSPKGAPILFELDLGPSTRVTLPEDGSGFCTWLGTIDPRAAGIECVALVVSGDVTIPRARAWIRVAWAEPSTAALPAWALAALNPGPSGGPAGPLAFELLEGDVFTASDAPLPMDEPSIEATSIARGPTGWVMGGAYQPISAGDDLSDADAPVWFSPDGRTWQRVDTPEVFGGPGYQQVRQVVADGTGWWMVGMSSQGSAEQIQPEMRLWHSPDGHAWRAITPECVTVTPTCPSGRIEIGRLEEARGGTVPSDGDGPLAVGNVAGQAAIVDLTADGRVAAASRLPGPPDAGESARTVPYQILNGAGATLAAGVADGGGSGTA